jgi:hypothetical protein
MKLKNYFLEQSGSGILSTADAHGVVDAAIYARPHVLDDGSLAMIMRDRLTRKNLLENPSAVYLFIEKGAGYSGVRLSLRKLREDNDPERIAQMTRRCLSPQEDQAKGPKFITYFAVEKIRPLIGGDELTRD